MSLSATPQACAMRARASLEGLSVGDAFGEQVFGLLARPDTAFARRVTSEPPWPWTDDTNMAVSLVEILEAHGRIDQDALAASFAARFDVGRSYGPAMIRMLRQVRVGAAWGPLARGLFEGQGSWGNGAAMRVAPLGAYFAYDLDLVTEQARLSAEVTHAHPEAAAGAIAVAVAAALVWRDAAALQSHVELIDRVAPYVPPSKVATRLLHARAIGPEVAAVRVAMIVGNGSNISAQDTVPFTLWVAGNRLGDFTEAMWQTASGMGDVDTTCAIVGGIVAGAVGVGGIPAAWRANREPLPRF